MKNAILSLLFIGLSITNNAQVFVENPQYFEWDTETSISTGATFALGSTRILATQNGVCVTTKKYFDTENLAMTKELHFFDPFMNLNQSIAHGITAYNVQFGRNEDFFLYDEKICVLDFQYIPVSDDSISSFHCFSIYSDQGVLLSTDTLWIVEYYPFYSGNLTLTNTPLLNKHISENYVYYLTDRIDTLDDSRNLIRCNLDNAQIEVINFPASALTNMRSFLEVDLNSLWVSISEQTSNSNINYIKQFDFEGNEIFSEIDNVFPLTGNMFIRDIISRDITTKMRYCYNNTTDRSSIEFLNNNFLSVESLDIHGDEFDSGRLFHDSGSTFAYLVLMPKYLSNYNYRLIEFDVEQKLISFDTLFAVSPEFRPFNQRHYLFKPESGDFIHYGIVYRENQNFVFFHRINAFERKAYIDSIVMPYNDSFQDTDYLNIHFANGQYYFVAVDELSVVDGELTNYCVGTLSIPTSIKPSPTGEVSFTIAPNPASHQISLLNLPAEPLGVHVIDLQGRTLYSGSSNRKSTLELPVEQLSKGIYFVLVQGANGVSTQKFIKH